MAGGIQRQSKQWKLRCSKKLEHYHYFGVTKLGCGMCRPSEAQNVVGVGTAFHPWLSQDGNEAFWAGVWVQMFKCGRGTESVPH